MDKLEEAAEQIHEGWREYYAGQGRILGPTRTVATHPHMVPWAELDNESQNQDRFIAAIVLDEWCRGHVTADRVAETIHEAWRRWEALHGREHAHARPFAIAHASNWAEHETQARRLETILVSTKAFVP